MAEHVRVRRPAPGVWQAGEEAASKVVSWALRHVRRLLASGPDNENAWEEWCSWHDDGMDFPPVRIRQTDEDVLITVQTPGYVARDLEVTVLPDRITVDGESETFRQKQDGPVFFADLGDRRMMWQFELPVPVRPETVRATWQDGVLLVVGRRRELMEQRVALAA